MDVAEAIPQQERFARHIKDGKACHTLFHTLNEFERVSDSPTQRKELKANPDIYEAHAWDSLLSHLVGDGLHSLPSC